MSSTLRGYDRHKSDYYITPIETIVEFLNEFLKVEPTFFSIGPILDPCAGGDQKNKMSYPEALKKVGFSEQEIFTVDIREDSQAEIIEDFLLLPSGDFGVIITNPPFNLALDIINKAINDVKEKGFVIMLLRLNFFGSKERQKFFKQYMPKYCFVHYKRISFTPDKKRDSIEYAHFVWQKGMNPNFTLLKVI
jgi:hypothetical protein